MSEFEIIYKLPESQYNEVILLDKYGDTYSLIQGQEGRDGQIYRRWVFPQGKDRKPLEKSIPMKISLGNRTNAINALEFLLKGLRGAAGNGINVPEEDIPF